MYFTQGGMDYNQIARSNDPAYVRVLHAAPDVLPVDVYINGVLRARNLNYRGFTEYISVPAGTCVIEIDRAGRRAIMAVVTFNISDRTIFTVAAVGLRPNISMLPIEEPKTAIPSGMAMIRFSHLSPTAPAVDITLPDGRVLFSNVQYLETTGYLPVPPATYRLQARIAGTSQVVLDVPNIRLMQNNYYTVYAVGLPGSQPPLQVLIPLDGQSYINT